MLLLPDASWSAHTHIANIQTNIHRSKVAGNRITPTQRTSLAELIKQDVVRVIGTKQSMHTSEEEEEGQ